MTVGRVGADDDDHVRLHDRIERLRAGGFADRVLQAIAGRRMADARAGVDVVVAEGGAHELLDEERLLRSCSAMTGCRRCCRGRTSPECAGTRDATWPIASSHVTSSHGSSIDFRIERRRDPIGMRRVPEGEPSLHAGVPVVGVTIPVRRHPHDRVALDLGLERTADAAIRTGRRHHAVGGADLDQRLLGQRHGRARFDAGAARHAFRLHERLVLAGGDLRSESAALDRQRERALHLVARAHAARADDAHRRVEDEVEVARVLGGAGGGSWPLNP